MIIKAQCEHCQADFEDEGLEKTVWCPSCGKETHVYAKGSNYTLKPAIENTDYDGMIMAGYALAILLPVVGFFIGLYLILKSQAGHGVAAMALSCVSSALWVALIIHLTSST